MKSSPLTAAAGSGRVLPRLARGIRRPSSGSGQAIARELAGFDRPGAQGWALAPLAVAFAFVVALFTAAPAAQAVVASPDPVELSQPDGRKVRLRIRGDERLHWHEDAEGFTVVRNQGRYVYARLNALGEASPSDLEAGAVDPKSAGLQKGLRPARRTIQRSPQTVEAESTTPEAVVSSRGTLRNLVLLCQFSDHVPGVHARARADYDTLFNRVGGDAALAPSGSVRDYYTEASYGTMVVASTVVGWITLPNTEAYYANGEDGCGGYPQNAQRMVEDALNLADALVDFAQFDTDNDGYVDSLTIIHSGRGAETGGGNGNWIWSHKWGLRYPWSSADRNASGVYVKASGYHTEPALWGTSGTGIVRIGVICHELGHALGLPDLYDTDYTSSGAGSYCLMANSWGFDGSQLHPPHMSAWCKMALGWAVPRAIGAGTYDAPQVEQSPSVFKITAGYPGGEYLLIENRQPVGFERVLPQGGIAVWHIDENKASNNDEGYPGQYNWPANGRHYKVALLQADGRYDLEHEANRGDAGDLYRRGAVSLLNPGTTPNTHSYQSGIVAATGNAISVNSLPGSLMNFTYTTGTTGTTLANGAFANRTTFNRAGGTVSGSNVNATKESGEPSHAGNAGGKSVWWTWTPSTSGSATLKTLGSSFDTTLAVYTGSAVSSLTLVPGGSNDDANGGVTSQVTISVAAGLAYQIAVDGYNADSGSITLAIAPPGGVPPVATPTFSPTPATYSSAQTVTISCATAGATIRYTVNGSDPTGSSTLYSGPVRLSSTTTLKARAFKSGLADSAIASGTYTINLSTGPANNHFANCTTFNRAGGTVSGSNVNATKESGEPNHAGNAGGKSVWWSWTPSVSGRTTLKTLGSNFDTTLAVYRGSTVAGLTLVPGGSNDDANGGVTSQVTISVTAGVAYQIAVDGYNAASGSISLAIAPPGGVAAVATPTFSPTPGTYASAQTVTISCATAGTTIRYTLNGSNPTTTSTLYTGPVRLSSTTTLKARAFKSGLADSAIAGGTYTINLSTGPANNHFANRTTFNRAGGTVSGSNVRATKESGEPRHAGNAGGKSVWWSWTPSASGSATIRTLGSNFDTTLAVYRGSTVAGLTLVPGGSNDDANGGVTSQVTISVTAGVAYQIAVDGYNAASGSITLSVSPSRAPAQASTEQVPLRAAELERLADGTCRIWIANADGTAINAAQTPAIEVYATTDLAQPLAAWTPLPGKPVAANGKLYLDDPEARNLPMRFYRVEQPQ